MQMNSTTQVCSLILATDFKDTVLLKVFAILRQKFWLKVEHKIGLVPVVTSICLIALSSPALCLTFGGLLHVYEDLNLVLMVPRCPF